MTQKTSSLPVAPEVQFWSHLREGRFMVQRSRSSDEYVFYPRLICPGSGDADLEFVEVSGQGVVYSTTVVRRSANEGGDYNMVIVDLDDGPRMLSRVMGVAPEDVKIGLRVVPSIEKVDFGLYGNTEQPIVVFRKAH
jgi:uncharacterized OB-fold protein